jgi:hypothetical protein
MHLAAARSEGRIDSRSVSDSRRLWRDYSRACDSNRTLHTAPSPIRVVGLGGMGHVAVEEQDVSRLARYGFQVEGRHLTRGERLFALTLRF